MDLQCASSSTTNEHSNKISKVRRLSDGSFKKYQYSRKRFEIHFTSEKEKEEFELKFETFKMDKGLTSVKEVFQYIFDSKPNRDKQLGKKQTFDTILGSVKYSNFICENKKLLELVDNVSAHQENCQGYLHPVEFRHSGHVAEVKWKCQNDHQLQWQSSSVLGTQYSVNYRMMMAYLCSGMAQVQYERLSQFLDAGILQEKFRTESCLTFSAIISVLARESMQMALLDEVQMSKDSKENGITIMTDARHQCRKNSYHTDHIALGQKTHKVINMQHITKEQERCTQKHEALGCQQMYDQFEEQNVLVNVHSHDRNMAVNKIVKTKDNVKNCNERWHATKPITKGIKQISTGARKNQGITWHPELQDKGARLRNHMYYAIDNCRGDPDRLRNLIDISVTHFQNRHDQCPDESACRMPDYIPEFTIIQSPEAVRLLTNFLHGLTLYKNAADYAECKDTYYIESFNNSCLIYLDKRLHYKDRNYKLRMDLAVLNWNEHVDRPFTSRNDRRREMNMYRQNLGKKAYKKKTYNFVNSIWQLLYEVLQNGEEIDGLQDVEAASDHYDETDDEN